MQGYTVLHPMGFDSFGLPAEQYAIEHNIHPAIITEVNIKNIRRQLQFLGLSYDWDREIATSHEDYYKWTQWIFLELFDAWFDETSQWTDACGQQIIGKARPIDRLIEEFANGSRCYAENDRKLLGDEAGIGWSGLSQQHQEAVLNNYRLVYQKEVMVNWCPGLGTVLANEEVTNEGRSERGDFPVYKRALRQWIMRITVYADRLLADLDATALPAAKDQTFTLDWPEPVKIMQRNWIGRSEGVQVEFEVLHPGIREGCDPLIVFTTRPDTLFGVTFMVVAPQHPLLTPEAAEYLVPQVWPNGVAARWKGEHPTQEIRQALATYQQTVDKMGTDDREEKGKTGIFTGLWARNPVNNKEIPIFTADYVSMDYGTGAIMAVPAHDERDYDFAQKYGLDVIEVVKAPAGFNGVCFTGEGFSINSPGSGEERPLSIDGLSSAAAKRQITAALETAGLGSGAVQYKLRDWIFSRQRYWGEPFPIATNAAGVALKVDLPVVLPPMDEFKPHTSNDPDQPVSPPLSRADKAWQEIETIEGVYHRELNVMPNWAGSCWYYLRFLDPRNGQAFCAPDKEQFFMPVDLYIGGAEHAVLHLLYSRFWHKVLYDLGHVSTPEPFKKLFNQGMITADAFTDEQGVYIDIRQVEFRDGEPYHRRSGEKLNRFAGKMGKRYKNGLPPEEIGEEFGVDTLRLYEMYMGPLEASTPWSMEGIRGMQRFLQRVWRNFVTQDGQINIGGEASVELLKKTHQTIKRVSSDIEGLRFNTAIAGLIELNNDLVKYDEVPKDVARYFLLMLNPLAPHLSEELWQMCDFGAAGLAYQLWPEADESLMVEEMITLPIQINGKMRANIEVPVNIAEEDLKAQVLKLENLKRYIPEEHAIKRFIVVPKRIINIVV